MSNVGGLDPQKLTYEELLKEYELSQWALAWALKKLHGSMMVTFQEQCDDNKQHRVWYCSGERGTFVELREHEG